MVRAHGERLARRRLEGAILLPILALSLVLHAWNLVATPWFFSDEGTYIYRAMYLQDHGLAYPPGPWPGFTFPYGHPPGGWALLALILALLGPLAAIRPTSALAYVLLGRATMVALATLEALLLHRIARRASSRPWVGLAAAGLMAIAPLSTTWGRMVLLDNLMAFWALLSLHVSLWGRARGVAIAPLLSGVALGMALLSKLPALFLIPVPLAPYLLNIPPTPRGQAAGGGPGGRWSDLSLWTLGFTAMALAWPLYAIAHGELGRLVEGLEWFASRNEGLTFVALLGQAVGRDPFLLLLGAGGIAYGLARARRGYLLLAMPALLYMAYLLWVRVRYPYYVAPLAPFLSLSAGLPLGDLIAAAARPRAGPRPSPGPLAPALLALLLLLPALQAWELDQGDSNGPGLAAADWVIHNAEPFSLVVTNAIYQGPIQRARPDLWVLYWMDSDFDAMSRLFFADAPPPRAAIVGPWGEVYRGPAMDLNASLALPGGEYTVTIGYGNATRAVELSLEGDTAVVARPGPRLSPAILRRPAAGPPFRLQVLDPLAMRLYLISDNTVCCSGWPADLFRVLLAAEGRRFFQGSSRDSSFDLAMPPGLYSVRLSLKGMSWRWVVPVGGPGRVVLVPGENATAPAEAPAPQGPGSPRVVLAIRDASGQPMPWAWVEVTRLNDLVRFPGPEGDAGVLLVPGVRSLRGIPPGPQAPP